MAMDDKTVAAYSVGVLYCVVNDLESARRKELRKTTEKMDATSLASVRHSCWMHRKVFHFKTLFCSGRLLLLKLSLLLVSLFAWIPLLPLLQSSLARHMIKSLSHTNSLPPTFPNTTDSYIIQTCLTHMVSGRVRATCLPRSFGNMDLFTSLNTS